MQFKVPQNIGEQARRGILRTRGGYYPIQGAAKY